MDNVAQKAVEALRRISRNEKIKEYLLQNPTIYKRILKAAMRFIGGETLDECFQTAQGISSKGHLFTVDFMGESTRDKKTANEATEEFLMVIEKIKETKCNASISLDLSHIGMVINKKLAHKNALELAKKAKEVGIEMIISMEGIDRTDDILNEYYKLSEIYDNVGITVQAYLHRTAKDMEEALKRPGRIRLVKGAYEVSKEFALPWGEKTDLAYKKYTKTILSINHLCSLATHDEKILSHADAFIKDRKIKKECVEIEMLYGVQPELLLEMHGKGYKTQVYLPYGKEWYLYLCHRLAENPLNIYQALADLVEIN